MSSKESEKQPRFEPKIKEKRWNHQFEHDIFESWQKERLYRLKLSKGKRPFVIDTPPPYPSGTWHIGAVAQYSQIDMIARTSRMLGAQVLFPIGIDRNGLPVEIYTESIYKVKMRETPPKNSLNCAKRHLTNSKAKCSKP